MASVDVNLWPPGLRGAVSKKTGVLTGPKPLVVNDVINLER